MTLSLDSAFSILNSYIRLKMNCPSCKAAIQDTLVIKAAASILGARGRGASKARDPKKMSEVGKLGGWKKGRPRKIRPSILAISTKC
jgi:hypothetical protein